MIKVRGKFYKIPIWIFEEEQCLAVKGRNILFDIFLNIAIWFHLFFNDIFDLNYSFKFEIDKRDVELFEKIEKKDYK